MNKIILIAMSFCSLYGSSQNYMDDSQLWLHLDLEKKINKYFDVNLKFKGRLTNNFSLPGQGYSDIGLGFKVNKNIKLIADYVYSEKISKNGIYKTRHTFYAAIILKKEVGRWQISYRNRLQFRYKKPFTSSDGYIAYIYDRNKINIKYEFTKHVSIYASEEIYIPLNNPQLKGISKSRSYIGLLLSITKHQKIEFYFMHQLQLQQGDWFNQDISYPNSPLTRLFVYGLGYNIEI